MKDTVEDLLWWSDKVYKPLIDSWDKICFFHPYQTVLKSITEPFLKQEIWKNEHICKSQLLRDLISCICEHHTEKGLQSNREFIHFLQYIIQNSPILDQPDQWLHSWQAITSRYCTRYKFWNKLQIWVYFSLSQVHPVTPALAPSVVATVKLVWTGLLGSTSKVTVQMVMRPR